MSFLGKHAAALLVAGIALAGLVVGLAVGRRGEAPQSSTVATAPSPPPAPAPVTSTDATAPPPPSSPAPTAPTPPAALPPTQVAFTWQAAGAFVWHTSDIDPEALGRELRANGFGWVAVLVHDGTSPQPLAPTWIDRFRRSSGLPVGGWGVLRGDAENEAHLAAELVASDALDFYVANAEVEYAYSGPDGPSEQRRGRSARFVASFRALQPSVPAALSSYCRTTDLDLDWHAWRAGRFDFLPQAYVNDHGDTVAPAACVAAAAGTFPAAAIHPTIGVYQSAQPMPTPTAYGDLLAAAGTKGFSIYLAETGPPDWRAFGSAIHTLAIARQPVAAP